MHAFGLFQCVWRVCSDGAAHMSAYIRTSRPADAHFGRDMKGVKCVACATTRQWSAFFLSFSFVRSYWNCVKGTNDVLSGMEVSRWLFGRLVFFLRCGQPQHRFTT